jgi:thymidylate kinase
MAAPRIALVGIDGGGKSTLARALARALRARGLAAAHLVCPAYHLSSDARGAPVLDPGLERLSRALERLSAAADARGARAAKGAAMFLQMRLYGRAEAALLAARPERIVAERHAVVDALAYAPLYLRADAGADAAALRILAEARDEIDAAAGPGAFERAAGIPHAAGLPEHLRRLFAPAPGLVERLEAAFETTLPERILLLEADPRAALERLAGRGGAPVELHETAEGLAALGASYERALVEIAAARPAVAIERLAAGDADAAAERLAGRL